MPPVTRVPTTEAPAPQNSPKASTIRGSGSQRSSHHTAASTSPRGTSAGIAIVRAAKRSSLNSQATTPTESRTAKPSRRSHVSLPRVSLRRLFGATDVALLMDVPPCVGGCGVRIRSYRPRARAGHPASSARCGQHSQANAREANDQSPVPSAR
ncbi:hypothetical protein ACFPRL_31405 [Pseudoclavibacter helvolus]